MRKQLGVAFATVVLVFAGNASADLIEGPSIWGPASANGGFQDLNLTSQRSSGSLEFGIASTKPLGGILALASPSTSGFLTVDFKRQSDNTYVAELHGTNDFVNLGPDANFYFVARSIASGSQSSWFQESFAENDPIHTPGIWNISFRNPSLGSGVITAIDAANIGPVTPVPIPPAVSLLGSALFAVVTIARRQVQQQS